MFKEKVLALILAGGKGGRLGLLTDNKAKPVMPFGGTYRLIDFALSNCVNSRISDVWVIEQYELHSFERTSRQRKTLGFRQNIRRAASFAAV